MPKLKDENYFLVSGWMLNKLNLKGNELCVFAIIYGFSQDGDSWYTGSRKYLADFTGASATTIDTCLTSLTKKGLIEKQEKHINGVKFNHYRVAMENLDTLQNSDTPSKNLVHPPPRNLDTPLQEFGTHNEIYNKEINEPPYNPPLGEVEVDDSTLNKMQETTQESTKVVHPTPEPLHTIKCRLNALFKRRETTMWTQKEIKAVREVARRPDVLEELEAIETLYNSGYEFRRRSIQTLLNNWTTDVDSARNNVNKGKDFFTDGRHLPSRDRYADGVNEDIEY